MRPDHISATTPGPPDPSWEILLEILSGLAWTGA